MQTAEKIFDYILKQCGSLNANSWRHTGEENEVTSFAPQTAGPSSGASQAYLRSSRADGFQTFLGKFSQVLSGRGRGCVGVHKFGLDLVSMLSSPGSQLQHLAGS
ncbi:MAG: hypothetical protein ACRD4F_16885, partial [Candidatus Angelobacter sp.]